MTSDLQPYCMRGHRVPALSEDLIAELAQKVCRITGMKRSSFTGKRTEEFIMQLEDYGIHVDIVDNEEWIDATRATVDPQTAMVYLPEKLYIDLCRGKAEAIRIFLHELGHIVLGHRPLLHFSDTPATQDMDSEWQADHFADSIIAFLKLKKEEMQLELKF